MAFTGSQACANCHAAEFDAWQTSQHALAMRTVTKDNVAGDFSDATVMLEGGQTRFTRDDTGYFVEATDRDGARRAFRVQFVLGVAPLEQYVLDYPPDRKQIPTIAWNLNDQRWFSIHGDERIDQTDPRHWTGPLQNWNSQCAECHTTGLVKGFEPAANTYATTYVEIGVGCEACHGRGSQHIAAARHGTASETSMLEVDLGVDEGAWIMNATGIARRQPALTQQAQTDACGRCHARRTAQTDDYPFGRPLLDTHRPALIEAPLYYADGQIRDEVFEWGSFLQSRMRAAGVICSDCHDPHAGTLEAPGDALCAKCHAPARFADTTHHHHEAAVACVDCHMSATVYMRIDRRRDHSFRVPRPDLTAQFAVPNACAQCHADQSTEWLTSAIERWYPEGRQDTPHFSEAFATRDARALIAVAMDKAQPGIVRASALLALRGELRGVFPTEALEQALHDDEALMRFAALQALEGLPAALTMRRAIPLLTDPVKNVRIEAARLIAPHEAVLEDTHRAALQTAIDELIAAETYNTDRGSGHLNLGNFHASRRDYPQAERDYLAGLRIEPASVALPLNLADVYRATGHDDRALTLLTDLSARVPAEPIVAEALALTLVRLKRYDDAVAALDRGLSHAPDADRLRYLRKLAIETRAGRD